MLPYLELKLLLIDLLILWFYVLFNLKGLHLALGGFFWTVSKRLMEFKLVRGEPFMQRLLTSIKCRYVFF